MAAKLLGPLRQIAVEPIAQAHPRESVATKITLAIDQDRRNPLDQELLDQTQGNRGLATARRPDECRVPR